MFGQDNHARRMARNSFNRSPEELEVLVQQRTAALRNLSARLLRVQGPWAVAGASRIPVGTLWPTYVGVNERVELWSKPGWQPKDAGHRLTWLVIMGRLQGESCCPQPDRGNPAVRDETGGRRKLTEARNEAPACSEEEPVTATPRCPPTQRLRSIPTTTLWSMRTAFANKTPLSRLNMPRYRWACSWNSAAVPRH
jgi:hypothetical protein